MTIDRVHDLQSAFRKLISAHARPGTIVNLGPEAGKIGDDAGFAPEFLLIALTLLDGETAFAVSSGDPDAFATAVSALTYAPRGTVETAAFVFVPDADADTNAVIGSCSPGTLLDPHLGSTVILGARDILGAGDVHDAESLSLRGPGIRGSAECAVVRGGEWLAGRNAKNAEYPLGVDVIFVTPAGKAVAFPRTTIITEKRGGS